MVAETILRETVKPSSPTPRHLRTFQLSLLDQMTPMVYTPIIFFYPLSDQDGDDHLKVEDASAKLKDSLSETLTLFYPLAGRIKDNLYVDCNDEGILFMETRVDLCLSDFLEQPKLELLDEFLPFPVVCAEPAELAPQVAVQLNVFASGGIAIGMCFSHKIIDGTAMSGFITAWADVARGTLDKAAFANNTAGFSLFPQRESLPTHSSFWAGSPFVKEGKSKARRFVFDAKAISKLKDKAASESLPKPTCVEAVSGFIWKCILNASRAAFGTQRPSVLAHAVNLRKRMEPPLPKYSIGNIAWKASACYENSENEIELRCLVGSLGKSIREIDWEYVQKLVGDQGFEGISKWLEVVGDMYSRGKPDVYTFTSWRNMGFNKVDFGWGKPIWVSAGRVSNAVFKNVVILMDTAMDDGIEAWFILEENEMAKLEQDPGFLEFATMNPGIALT